MNAFALRLRPHQDLRNELEAFARSRELRAAFVITCVGSLRHAALRLADKDETTPPNPASKKTGTSPL